MADVARAHIHNGYSMAPYSRLVRLGTAHNIARSHQQMVPGQATVDIAMTDPAITPDAIRIGNILAITSSIAPPWAGPITLIDEKSHDGIITLEAQEWTCALQVRGIPLTESWSEGGSGAVFASIIKNVNTGGHTGLYLDGDYESGPAIVNDNIGGQMADQALNDLHSRTDYEWWPTYIVLPSGITCVMHWGQHQGFDRSKQVFWIEGRDFVKRERVLDISKVRQAITVVGGRGPVASRTATTKSTSTAPEYAVLGTALESADQDLIEFTNPPPMLRAVQVLLQPATSDRQSLSAIAEQTLERLIADAAKYPITLNTVQSWANIGVGDYVTIVTAPHGLGSVQQRARIVGMQPDEETGTCDAVCQIPVR